MDQWGLEQLVFGLLHDIDPHSARILPAHIRRLTGARFRLLCCDAPNGNRGSSSLWFVLLFLADVRLGRLEFWLLDHSLSQPYHRLHALER